MRVAGATTSHPTEMWRLTSDRLGPPHRLAFLFSSNRLRQVVMTFASNMIYRILVEPLLDLLTILRDFDERSVGAGRGSPKGAGQQLN